MSRLHDAESANGCFVDGERRDSTTLQHGTVIRLGDTVFVFAEKRITWRPCSTGLAVRPRPTWHSYHRSDRNRQGAPGPSDPRREQTKRRIHRSELRVAVRKPRRLGTLRAYAWRVFRGGCRAPGLFRAAHRGTLLLDEIGDLPLCAPAGALEGRFKSAPFGPSAPSGRSRIDVRVVAATHQDLRRAMDQNTFRRDLFARLAQVELRLPPLERAHLRARNADRRDCDEAWSHRSRERRRHGGACPLGVASQREGARKPLAQAARVLRRLRVSSTRGFSSARLPSFSKASERRERPQGAPAPSPAKRPSREELSRVLARHGGNVVLAAAEFGTSRTANLPLAQALRARNFERQALRVRHSETVTQPAVTVTPDG